MSWFTYLGIENPAQMLALVKMLLRIFLIIGIAYFLNRLSKQLIVKLRDTFNARQADNIEEIKRLNTLSMVLRYIVTTVILAITVVEILHELGISIAPVLAAAGVVGLAVGFGAQSLVKDYFNGFFLLLENQIRKDDVVEIADKAGLVEEITLRYIKMRDYEGNVHYVPNGQITTVTNRSRDYAYAVMDIGVAYKENIEMVMQIMQEVGNALYADTAFNDKILDALEMAGVDELGDSAVVIRCRYKVRPLEQWTIKREYLKRIKNAFDQQGIEIPFPHLTVYQGAIQQALALD
ncbi:mechanosensitive ion channel family protein [Methylophilus medardicus]|uniref:Mechanosensitive ion channel family protein n=1 Tax=Methylophilus medardicus TaxID=2588534 RepID=A0A5B8CT50_9PROT|nr:mechanosensitive ion channel family protein [Methylophilus medardicus]QDC44492.1 mechanosensitive ion channel family protein [Methylophilus medardicus]QDC49499.1 mechanosensitive ion channel family protein [Methylophilus medardicus]QDC53204.1 mechanosensitive ion channel family protein [Methylophilus medardicus]